ncbi:winged helix-turn-helix domain-containing protein [Chloroflexi bacterium TSY]|nr:winged helix-turn-helix domain-containing protein [Chloroflexi bacterium TSY]
MTSVARRLRNAIKADSEHQYIHTVRGRGYRFSQPIV